MVSPKPVVSNAQTTLGRMRDEAAVDGQKLVTDTVKQVVSEPAKILEKILGGKAQTSADQKSDPLEQGMGSDPQDPQAIAQAQQKQQLLIRKQQEDQEKKAKLIKLHRDRLQQEIEYFQRKKQQEEQQKQMEEQQEEQKKEQEVVQLQHEKEQSVQLAGQLAGKQGSHETRASKF